MNKKFLAFIGCLIMISLATSIVKAEDVFFIDCEKAFQRPEFQVFANYMKEHENITRPDKCFRLNDYEFLATVSATSRIGQGLYVFDVKKETFDLYEGGYIPEIEIVREILGQNNKRYVLLSWSNLAHGNWDSGYAILQLILRPKEGLPIVLYDLLSANEDPVAGLCGEWSSTDQSGKTEKFQNITEGKKSRITGHQVLNEGTERVQIIFSLKEQDCKTLHISNYTKRFALKNTRFVEAEDAKSWTAEEVIDPIDNQLKECVGKNSTTTGMADCARAALEAWDKELNGVYGDLMRNLDANAKAALEKSQREWIKFRDGEFEFINKYYDGFVGTMYVPMRTGDKAHVIKERTIKLRSYLKLLDMR